MRVRKRVVTLGLCLGLAISQIMIYANNKATASDIRYNVYSTDAADFSISGNLQKPKPSKNDDEQKVIDATIVSKAKSQRKDAPSKNNEPSAPPYQTSIAKPTTTETICKNQFGINFFKDPVNRKIIIINILKNSPADRAGLHEGDEIMRINNKKVAWLIMQVVGILLDSSGKTIELSIRDIFNNKKKVVISKNRICMPKPNDDSLFNTYWFQVGPDIQELNQTVFQHASNQAKTDYYYWISKKRGFQSSYNSCKIGSMSEENFHYCMRDLVNRYLSDIQRDRDIQLQQEMIQAQMRMNNQYVNAVNNYADAMRNQNVNHSGTLNVNSNINHNVYWHNW